MVDLLCRSAALPSAFARAVFVTDKLIIISCYIRSQSALCVGLCVSCLCALFRHVANASGVNWNAGDLDFTGAQMVLTLKLISMAMCFQDANSKKEDVSC